MVFIKLFLLIYITASAFFISKIVHKCLDFIVGIFMDNLRRRLSKRNESKNDEDTIVIGFK